MPKVLSGSRFWVVPIGLIQHQLLKRRQLMDKGTSDSSVATTVSKTNPTTKVKNNASRDPVMFEALKLPFASLPFYYPRPHLLSKST
jgi:hypothetical protein